MQNFSNVQSYGIMVLIAVWAHMMPTPLPCKNGECFKLPVLVLTNPGLLECPDPANPGLFQSEFMNKLIYETVPTEMKHGRYLLEGHSRVLCHHQKDPVLFMFLFDHSVIISCHPQLLSLSMDGLPQRALLSLQRPLGKPIYGWEGWAKALVQGG